MRRLFVISAIALVAALGVDFAEAQVRIESGINGEFKVAQKLPRVRAVKPKVKILPPSAALKRAMRVVPDAKAIGVTLQGDIYIVRLKTSGKVAQVAVNSVTGAVVPIP